MFKLKHLSVTFTLLVGVTAEFVVLERRDNPPPGFSRLGPPAEDDILSLRLALPSRNILGLHDAVYEISTPGNIRYGQYLTRDEIAQFVAPAPETVSKVTSWLSNNNLTAVPITPASEWITVNMMVSQANALLAANFSTFRNDETNQTVLRTLSYSIPSTLKTSIDWVHPTTSFPEATGSIPPTFVNKTSAPIAGLLRVSRSFMEFRPLRPKKTANVFGVSGFDNASANKQDLQTFLQVYRPDMNPNTTFDSISVDGGVNNPAGADVFSAPEIQYAVGLTTGVQVTFILTGNLSNDLRTEMLDQATHLLSLENPPQTILNTAGFVESGLTPEIANSLCNVYAQLAARGVSYIVETGGFGAGVDCRSFDPPFPASCPFVTAVGATEFDNDEPAETAYIGSGGGFSNFFSRPRYQDTAVSAYLKATNNVHNTAFNVSGRAVPDVSAISSVPFIALQEIFDNSKSTAYSAAIFASIVSLLTNERISAGKSPLGFLNPLIYANPSAFSDVKTGSNTLQCGIPAFNATSGWDAVTGFGSPSYPKLKEILDKV
ncbi:Serine protease S53 [Mycena venus]|uniref:Serine protease S53 n=1 Tax=Mycena venus TaxID=2733690 RepID=A0A8H6WSM4_9AGAR|nr:Serine protease S53 [Mycena venus]